MQRTASHYVIIGRTEQGPVGQWVVACGEPIAGDITASERGRGEVATVLAPPETNREL
jgi:hypothetical protein